MTDYEHLDRRRLDAETTDVWREYVAGHDASTPFHTLDWRRAVESAFDYRPHYELVCDVERDEVAAVVPAFETSNAVGADLTQPFCEYGYPLVGDGVDPRGVLDVLSDTPGRFDARVLKESKPSRVRGYNQAGFGGVETGVTFRLRLDRPYGELRSNVFDTEVRRNVENARESGLRVRETDDVDAYYRVYLATMRRLGSPQFPRSFFEALRSEFGDRFTLLVAEDGDEAVAGVLLLATDAETIVWSNASLEEYWDATPNHLLYARSVELAADRGRSVVDFGRTDVGSGVYTFKRQFGGDELPLVSMVAPPHLTPRGSVGQYRRLRPVVERLAPVITHPSVGPRLKEWIHE